jgi:hypothetical protein
MTDKEEVEKEYVLWTYADYGWHPQGFDTIKEALEAQRYTSEYFITSGKLNYTVEKTLSPQQEK